MDNEIAKKASVLAFVPDNRLVDVELDEVANSAVSDWPLWLTVPMVAKRLSLGKTKVYELIELAGLPVVRVGRAVRVPTARFLRWVEEFEKQSLSA